MTAIPARRTLRRPASTRPINSNTPIVDGDSAAAPSRFRAETRRIGPAWQAFGAATKTVSLADEGATWGSLAAVYPEMQDWIQRRGHGGARPWTEPSDINGPGSAAEVAALKAKNDIVIIQFHAGFQFEEAAGENVVLVAQHMIDAGADIVIAHHPHILQGLGFYKNKLIAFSLGNFIFDQDFLSTFGSVMLRTVWEGSNMIEARLVPVEIESYQPRFVSGVAAQNDLMVLYERSQLQARTAREPDQSVEAHLLTASDGITPASLLFEHGTAKVVADAPVQQTVSISVGASAIAPIDPPALCKGNLGTTNDDILVGRDMFGWGRFEPELAGLPVGRTHWDVGTCDKDVVSNGGATGLGYLRLRREAGDTDILLARPIAQIPLFHHRFFDDTETPVDPNPTYTLHFAARRTGTAKHDRADPALPLRRHQPDRGPDLRCARDDRLPIYRRWDVRDARHRSPHSRLGVRKWQRHLCLLRARRAQKRDRLSRCRRRRVRGVAKSVGQRRRLVSRRLRAEHGRLRDDASDPLFALIAIFERRDSHPALERALERTRARITQ